ncbi:helix-turn-helix domain-containing protein [Streptomyces albidoflavus]
MTGSSSAMPAHGLQKLGAHLHRSRCSQRVSREYLAFWIGADPSTVARIEQGRADLRIRHLAAIESALSLRPGSSLEVLAGVDGRGPDSTSTAPSRPPSAHELATEITRCGHRSPCH